MVAIGDDYLILTVVFLGCQCVQYDVSWSIWFGISWRTNSNISFVLLFLDLYGQSVFLFLSLTLLMTHF